MLYSIPVNKLDKLEKIIRRYQRKGADITFTVGKDIVEDGMLYFNDPSTHTQGHTPIKVNCKEVHLRNHLRYIVILKESVTYSN